MLLLGYGIGTYLGSRAEESAPKPDQTASKRTDMPISKPIVRITEEGPVARENNQGKTTAQAESKDRNLVDVRVLADALRRSVAPAVTSRKGSSGQHMHKTIPESPAPVVSGSEAQNSEKANGDVTVLPRPDDPNNAQTTPQNKNE